MTAEKMLSLVTREKQICRRISIIIYLHLLFIADMGCFGEAALPIL